MSGAQKSGAVSRGFHLGKLGLSLMGSYLGYQAQNAFLGEDAEGRRRARFQEKTSRKVREEFAALKGPVMKLGQILSMQTDFLPEEAIRQLTDLQMSAPGMHPTLARAQFKAALGKYPEDVFREFDPEPFAAASLGQVHRAVTRAGEKVAVKIQYPAIREAIENDFALLRSATLPTQFTGHVPTALLDEIQRGILEETDYVREAGNLELFRKGLSHLPFAEIPRPLREFSSERVLTMSYIEGESLAALLSRKPPQEFRDLVGARVVEMCETQFVRLKVIHADQHPGNYRFRRDGTIGLVDFGCVKRIAMDVRELRGWYRARIWRESEAAARRFVAATYGPRARFDRARKLLPLLEQWCDLIYPKGPQADIIFDCRRDPAKKPKFKEIAQEHTKRVFQDKLINPDFAFIIRADIGLHHLLHELGAVVNFSAIERAVAPA